MRFFLLILLFLVQLCFASSNVNDDKRIKDSLLKYNYGIIKMTNSGNTKLLKDMLSQEVYFKLMVWADSWKFSNLAMVAQINDLRFSPIAYNENNATIRTMENWTFGYADLVKRDYALKPMTIFYKMKYTLKKHHGEWIIVAVENLQEEVFTEPNTHETSLLEKKEKPKEEAVQGKIETH
ncbi:hypothetical protein [Sulfurimonas sp.]|jgi:hypothetical protein|uniref:hypothetical protein n=1 Tax=Sulfurimonas sp. TaxID=2022749 RepID=UPI0025EEED4D|nr:hypothetical protein [Sulfurimonas sp.]MCK9472122.1 hypothetical protein [Sulfurimonas sp.]MDD3505171.1 hypothetical protein [Sulfurimonas sp.]